MTPLDCIHKIDSILRNLNNKLKSTSPSPKVQAAVTRLLKDLKQHRNEFVDDKSSLKLRCAVFTIGCIASIEDTMSTLASELDWCSYLQNIVKNITNAFITALSLGYNTHFFKPILTPRQQSVIAAQQEIEEWNGQLQVQWT